MKWIIAFVGFAIILGVLVRIGTVVSSDEAAISTKASTPSAQTPAEKAKADKDSANQVVAATGAQAIRHAMRDPDSFKLSSVLVMDSGAVCYEYRARNGFNGLNVGYAVLSPKGRLKTDEMDGFSALWHRECANKTGDEDVDVIAFILDHAPD